VTLSTVEIVTSQAASVIHTSEVGDNVTREQIENLPSRDRNFLDLAKLAPGINQPKVDDQQKKFSAGASPADFVNVFIDGASYKNDVLQGGVAGQDASRGNPFPQNAVQEFRVITQNFKAEYQQAASAIITATTRSGGNEWEGGFFGNVIGHGEYFTARDPIAVREGRDRPDFRRVQGGLSLGGPIIRDKLFFFGTYELNSQNSPGDVILGGDADLAPPGLNPEQYVGRFTQEFRQHLGFGKLTYTPSDRHTFDFSLNIRDESDVRGFGGQTSFESAEDVQQQIYTGVASWRFATGPWLNEAQISGQHYKWNPKPLNEQEVGLNYLGIIRIGGRDTEQRFTQQRLSLRNDVTRSAVEWMGQHVFKAGASLDFLSYEGVKFFNGNPVFEFRQDEDYLFPFQARFGFGDPQQEADNTQFGIYVQDDWQVTDRLLLNIGVRWDVETNMFNNDFVTPQPLRDSLSTFFADSLFVTIVGRNLPPNQFDTVRTVELLGGLDNYFTDGREDRPAYKKAIQPRIGASYDVFGDGNTVLFGGFGVYYDRNYWNQMFDEEFRRDYKVLTIEFNDVGPTPTCSRCVQWDPKYFDRDELLALAQSGTSGLPEVFLIANDTKPPRTHHFSAGIRQVLGGNILSLSYAGSRGYNGFSFIRGTRCDSLSCNALQPTYARLLISDDRVKTWYDALLLKWDRPLRSDTRWGAGLSYTWAFNHDRQGNFFFSLDPRYATVADFPRRRAPDSQEHSIVANGIFRLPWNFLASTVVTLGTGFTQLADDQTLGTNPAFVQQYIFEPPTRSFLGIGHVFALQNMDLRLGKNFILPNGQRAGLAIDLFNVFNSRNFACYDARIPVGGNPADNDNFGKPNCAAPGRRLQIGLNYDFGPSIAGFGGR
jgi:outer membrane receptor protein involved in Fe transport